MPIAPSSSSPTYPAAAVGVAVRRELEALLAERILIVDGAMGSMVQRYELAEDDFRGEAFKAHPKPLKGLNDLLVITRPDVIGEIHRKYLEAGADLIETNTFNATSIGLADYGLQDQVFEVNRAAAALAASVARDFERKNPGQRRWSPAPWGPRTRWARSRPT